MNIEQFSNQLQQQVKAQAEALHAQNTLIKASRMMSVIQEAIARLQQYIHSYKFASLQEEIKFFKEIKPVLLSQYYFYRKQLNMAMADSFQDEQSRKSFYEHELRKLQQFIKRNQEFYRYCITCQTYLDEQYFTRKTIHFSVGKDLKFATRYDDKLARLLSVELIREELNEKLGQLQRTSKTSTISWTGNKTDAVELIAALHAVGSLNNGEVELKQVIKCFEECFNLSLGNYYDLFKKIRLRKGPRSHFLDALKEKFASRIKQMEL